MKPASSYVHPNTNVDKSPTVSDDLDNRTVMTRPEKIVVMVSQVSPEIADLSGESSQDYIIPSSPVKKEDTEKEIS